MQPMDSVPTDKPVRLHLPGGLSFPACLLPFEGDDRTVWGWVCLDEGQAPDDWTEGVCWSVNENGNPSTQPIGWSTLSIKEGGSDGRNR